jgi:hypothetical protein
MQVVKQGDALAKLEVGFPQPGQRLVDLDHGHAMRRPVWNRVVGI